MGEKVGENPELSTIGEAIEALRQMVPRGVQERYFMGPDWDDIVSKALLSLDDSISVGSLGNYPGRLYLAAFLVNIVVQSVLQEPVFDFKVDPVSYKLVPLSYQDITDIFVAVTNILVFVKENLHVEFEIDPETNRPHVMMWNVQASEAILDLELKRALGLECEEDIH
jgi:hypothetical protein